MQFRRTFRTSLAAMAATGALIAVHSPALADVKAGVDAWSRGDYAQAVREWSGPAADGDPDAQFNMAQAYRLGRGVTADPAQAEALYGAAAAQGHTKAADNYGLLLFQDGRREQALPYVQAASDRGDPRAQYLIGVAHFNGDLVEKDWVRAYALLTLANNTGLPQARGALTQMDEFIPLDQREQAQPLAAQLKADAEARRARELAAEDLTRGAPQIARPRIAGTTPTPVPMPTQAPPNPVSTPTVGTSTQPSAGADYTLPSSSRPTVIADNDAVSPPAQTPSVTQPQPVRTSPPVTRTAAAATGPWKLQLGAFGVSGNARRLGAKLSGNPALSGASVEYESEGNLTKVMATGYASRASAQSACAELKSGGLDCLVTR